MLTTTLKSRVARATAAAAAAALMAGTSVMGGTPAGADPKQFAGLTGVGSDTTQAILNAFAGHENGLNYTPLQSSTASGKRQIASFDAIGTDCITTKAGTNPAGPTFLRPNGSTNGRKALSRAIDGGTFPAATALCGGPKAMAGQINFARSSAYTAGATTELTYIPFARDALSFAYYRSSGASVTTLTSGQLTSLFETGPQIIDGVEIVPCGIQTGSGTYQFWNTALTLTVAEEAAGTATCEAATPVGRLQENDGDDLKAKGDSAALLGKQVIVGFSAANFVAQINGVAVDRTPAGVDLGAIDALGKPYTGSVGTPPIAPSDTFYSSPTYGRDVYNVVSTVLLGGPPAANGDLKTMFVGGTSAVCSPAVTGPTGTRPLFGYGAPVLACGATTLRGPLLAN